MGQVPWGVGIAPQLSVDYECLGGPLDGQKRRAPSAGGFRLATRWFFCERVAGDGEPANIVVESVNAPAPIAGWIVLGLYDLGWDELPRRGRRVRWRWHSGAAWPIHVSTLPTRELLPPKFTPPAAKPFEPPAPPTSFENDENTDATGSA